MPTVPTDKKIGIKYVPAQRPIANHLLDQQRHWLSKPKTSDIRLLQIAAAFFSLACLLLLIGGSQSAFHTLQWFSYVLPGIAWQQITFLGDTLTVLTISLFFAYRYPHVLFAILITAILGTLITHSIKPLLDIPRPPAVLELDQFRHFGDLFYRNSMPSGHTLTAFAFCGVLTRIATTKPIKIVLLGIAMLIGYSRVAVGVHWPTDVCMGAAGGLISAYGGLKLADRWLNVFNARFYFTLLIIMVSCAVALLFHNSGYHSKLLATLLCIFSLSHIYKSLRANHHIPEFNGFFKE